MISLEHTWLTLAKQKCMCVCYAYQRKQTTWRAQFYIMGHWRNSEQTDSHGELKSKQVNVSSDKCYQEQRLKGRLWVGSVPKGSENWKGKNQKKKKLRFRNRGDEPESCSGPVYGPSIRGKPKAISVLYFMQSGLTHCGEWPRLLI